MGYQLCMTEKPSVAGDISRVIKADRKCDGYYEGNGYRVTWALGHLVGLAEPEAYGFLSQAETWKEENRERALHELPLIPPDMNFRLVVLDETRQQFEKIRALIHDPECEGIINCGDMGPEGHILQWLIRTMAENDRPVRRFCAVSMTDEAIRYAMDHLRPEEEFDGIIRGEYCRKKADWILGLSLSRLASLKYHTFFTVGRVQSPTLYYVVERYLRAASFKSKPYYTLTADCGGIEMHLTMDRDDLLSGSNKDSEERMTDRTAVMELSQQMMNSGTAEIMSVEEKDGQADRPQLYDITELERDACRIYGYSAAETLAAAQALYETQKVLSYPRTDSRYITSDLKPVFLQRLKDLQGLSGYAQEAAELIEAGPLFDSRVVDDSKVTDHHALIVTERIQGFDISSMKPTQKEAHDGVTAQMMHNVLHLVITRMITALSKPYRYHQVNVLAVVDLGSERLAHLAASGRTVTDEGWKAVQKKLLAESVEKEKPDRQCLPALAEGQTLKIRACTVNNCRTKPPAYHTEATLLTAMEMAGRQGIGTPATRAEIIRKLFDRKYIEYCRKEKTNYIVPTNTGIQMITALPHKIYSPQITAEWEDTIADIADGKKTEADFFEMFLPFMKEMSEELWGNTAMLDFSRRQSPAAVCSFCGGNVYQYASKRTKGASVFVCENNRREGGTCCFMLAEDNKAFIVRRKKPITDRQALKLINGPLRLSCTSKEGKPYKAEFMLGKAQSSDGQDYTNILVNIIRK